MPKTRGELLGMLGEMPRPDKLVSGKFIETEDLGNFTVERLVMELNGYEQVPALFAYPQNTEWPVPAVLFNHSHGYLFDIGKTEVLEGCPYMLKRGFAYDLTAAGIAVLAIDHMCFEERSGKTDSYIFKKLLWDNYVMWGWMIFDSLRALDYLCSRPEVDKKRIATLGMSMGSVMSQWVAALDERIKVCVDICCLTNFDEFLRQESLELHGIYYYVPGLYKKFSCADINALTAPRPHLSLVGEFDPLTPAYGLDEDNKTLHKIYSDLGKPENWQLRRYPVAHQETHEMRQDTMCFLRQHL